jgi:hypothetical protein
MVNSVTQTGQARTTFFLIDFVEGDSYHVVGQFGRADGNPVPQEAHRLVQQVKLHDLK